MKTRDHYKCVDFDAKEETIRKFMQTSAMNVSKNDWELVRVVPHTQHSLSNFFTKAHPEARKSRLVPIFCIDEFGSSSRREDYLHR